MSTQVNSDAVAMVFKVLQEHGGSASVAEVVREASRECDGSLVREAYWRLLAEHQLERTASGEVKKLASA